MKKKVLPVRELLNFTPVQLKEGLTTNLSILFEDDKVIDLSFREVVLLRFILDIYWNIPKVKIISKHCYINYYTNGILTDKTINKSFESILEDIVNIYIKPSNNRKLLEATFETMYNIVNNIYNFLTYDLIEYSNSINITDLLDIQMKPKLIKAMKEVYDNRGKEDLGITAKRVTNTYDILNDILWNDKSVYENPVAKAYRSGTVNGNQVKQVLASRGFVTELDSHIFRYPIASSFTLGMTDIYDQTIESRSGARALYLATNEVSNSEYFARQIQLVTMVVEKLIDGDCGSKEYMDWYVRPKDEYIKADLDNLLGKYYLNEETGKEEMITKNHKHLEGKTIKLRSSINCKLEDPRCVCTRCFGELSYGIPVHSNLGHYCSTTITQKISQAILSTKHLATSASSGLITLDANGQKFFIIKNSNYIFKSNILGKSKTKYELVFPQFQAFGIKGLKDTNNIHLLNPSRVSLLKSIIIREITEEGSKEYFIVIQNDKKRGSFTHEFLEYISKVGFYLDNAENYVINLDGWNSKKPFISMPELEYNFVALSKNVKNLVSPKEDDTGITPESLIQEIFDKLNVKLDINVAPIEIIVYALTAIDPDNNNYHLARNVPKRHIVNSRKLIDKRSLGASYGWEHITRRILDPLSFYNKTPMSHPLDVMTKPEEVIERIKNN